MNMQCIHCKGEMTRAQAPFSVDRPALNLRRSSYA